MPVLCFSNMNPGLPIKRFKAAMCKTLLEKTIAEADLLIETKEKQMSAIRLEIFKLLAIGQERAARVWVVDLLGKKNARVALQIIIRFCRRVAKCLRFIESERFREFAPSTKEAVSSLCFAASRFDELSDLKKVRSQFSIKFGEEFISNAIECKPDCGVNKQLIELLLVPTPPENEVNRLLKEIAFLFELNWDPASADEDKVSTFAPDSVSQVVSVIVRRLGKMAVPKRIYTRIDTLELKAVIVRKVGHQNADKYFDQLGRLLSSKISKAEFDKICIMTRLNRCWKPEHSK